MRVIIFANGPLSDSTDVQGLLSPEDMILAADGGARHCQKLGIIPNTAIGDFDSLTTTELEALTAANVKLCRYPLRKDFTDLELAMQHAIALGADEIIVFGALGARWDQTLANLLLPASDLLKDTNVRLLDGQQEITLLRDNSLLHLKGKPGDTISLIPLGGNAIGITTTGLEYPLTNGALYFGATRGISNVLLGEQATVQLTTGLLLCVLIHLSN